MSAVRLSVKAIIVREDRLLVLKCQDPQGVWYVLPGGGQQVGETLPEALRRECLMFECELESEPTVGTEPDSMQTGFEWLDVATLVGRRLYPQILESALRSPAGGTTIYFGDVN